MGPDMHGSIGATALAVALVVVVIAIALAVATWWSGRRARRYYR